MVKEKDELKDEKDEVKAETKSERQLKWEKFLVKHKEQNPVKFALKKLEGSKVPDSFIG